MCVVSLSSPIPTFSLSLEWQPKDTSRNCFAVMYQPGTLYSSNPYMQSAKHDRKISNLEVFCLTRMRTDTSISRILWTLHHHGTWPVSVLYSRWLFKWSGYLNWKYDGGVRYGQLPNRKKKFLKFADLQLTQGTLCWKPIFVIHLQMQIFKWFNRN